MNEYIFELYKQTNIIRQDIIQNFDNQVIHIRELFSGIIIALITLICTLKLDTIFFIILALVCVLFWIIETSVKVNQRGYILLNNRIQKEMANAKNDDEVLKVINKYHSDMNGFYSLRIENANNYKKQTRFLHTMFMKNVCTIYLSILFSVIGCSIIIYLST